MKRMSDLQTFFFILLILILICRFWKKSPKRPDNIPDDVWDVIKACFNVEASTRPAAEQLLLLPFFNDSDNNSILDCMFCIFFLKKNICFIVF
jgi:hypothetical protein